MLRVNIHGGPAKLASRFNLISWLDIGYEDLAPVADYKAVLFQNGHGAGVPVPIKKYARWSSSLWDLVARAIALCLREGNEALVEELPSVVELPKGFAFATEICALIYHVPGPGNPRTRMLGSMSICQVKRKRGTYVAKITEHTMSRKTTAPFVFQPEILRPAELVLRACAAHLTGQACLPPRPELCVPVAFDQTGAIHVSVRKLVEPAKTGLVSWLTTEVTNDGMKVSTTPDTVPMHVYQQFLSEAV